MIKVLDSFSVCQKDNANLIGQGVRWTSEARSEYRTALGNMGALFTQRGNAGFFYRFLIIYSIFLFLINLTHAQQLSKKIFFNFCRLPNLYAYRVPFY